MTHTVVDQWVLTDSELTGDETYPDELPSPLRTHWWYWLNT
jgi:hypothetical protein